MEGAPSNSVKHQDMDSATLLPSQHQPLESHHRPLTTSTNTPFFSTRQDREPAFAISDYGKPILRSSHSLAGGSRLEGARRLSGHIPGTGAFHPVQPLAIHRNTEQFANTLTPTNGSQPFHSHLAAEEVTEDKRLSKRKRKANNLVGSVCTICGVTVRPVELPAHFAIEIEKLNKITRSGKSSRETSSQSRKVTPSASSTKRRRESNEDVLESRESRHEEHKRVKRNRLERLNARLGRCRKGLKRSSDEIASSVALCPICHEVLTGSAEDRNTHAVACLRKVNPGQEDVDEDIDVDGEEEEEGFEEYTWCGQTRVRATSMLDSRFSEAGFEVGRKETDCDAELNVDDDDTAEFGPEQFTEADIIPCPSDDSTEDKQRQALRDAVVGNDGRTSPLDSVPDPWLPSTSSEQSSDSKLPNRTMNTGSMSAQSETIIDCLKTRVRELQEQVDSAAASRIKCLICMDSFSVPLVSIQCWHVHCQQCWLRTLGAKKLCPQCNMITSPGQLRRIYL
ncbi:E3 ubiquitin-protein ligase RNF220-like isoform X2 [Asterias amurensis]|uniref:E3 ubiquitin-protein ligase RNF220-like isoform X2 n=1 Tax=Asterias amurensis TaxID=7602 RepID=UPI003AB5DA07